MWRDASERRTAAWVRGSPHTHPSHPIQQLAAWAVYEIMYGLVYGSVGDAAAGHINDLTNKPANVQCMHYKSRRKSLLRWSGHHGKTW